MTESGIQSTGSPNNGFRNTRTFTVHRTVLGLGWSRTSGRRMPGTFKRFPRHFWTAISRGNKNRRESSGGMEWLGVWNCVFSGSLKFGEYRSFCGISWKFRPLKKYLSDSGKWPFHTPPIHTPTKCRPKEKEGKNLSSQTWSGSPRRPSPRHPRPPDGHLLRGVKLRFRQLCASLTITSIIEGAAPDPLRYPIRRPSRGPMTPLLGAPFWCTIWGALRDTKGRLKRAP